MIASFPVGHSFHGGCGKYGSRRWAVENDGAAGGLIAQRLFRAGVIKGRKLFTAEFHVLRLQAAMAVDPVADFGRVEAQERLRALGVRHQRMPRIVEDRSGVKAEHSAVGHTNTIAWDDAGEKRARREARAVDDKVLSRLAQLLEFLDVRDDFATRVVNDVDFCECRSRDEGRRERAERQPAIACLEPLTRSPDDCQLL